jgi:hypothetical protein
MCHPTRAGAANRYRKQFAGECHSPAKEACRHRQIDDPDSITRRKGQLQSVERKLG